MKCGHCKQEGHSKRTCPVLSEMQQTMKCGHCKQEGHSKRTCPVLSEKITYLKPPLKWVGSKQQIMNEVLALYPTQMNNYIEPFLGGGSVLLGVLSLRQQGKIGRAHV